MSLFSLMSKYFPKAIKDYIKFNIGILDHSTLLKKLKKKTNFILKLLLILVLTRGNSQN